MKINYFVRLAAVTALLWMAGCQQGSVEEPEAPAVVGGDITRFSATIPTPEPSRAVINSENKPTWKAGDNMLILSYNGASITNFKSMIDGSTANESTSYFTTASGRTLPKGRENYAVYPYFQPKLADVSGGSNGDRKFKLTLGEQTPSFDSNLHLPLLVGVWDDASENFTMSNPLLIVRLKLALPVGESDLTMKRIRVTGNNGEALWGSAALFETSDMSLEINEEGAIKELSLDCTGKTLGAEGKTVSFCIPAQEYAKGLNVKVFCLEGSFEANINPSGMTPSADTILEEELTVALAASNIIVDVVRATDTTVVVAWTGKKENAKYLSQIYPDDSVKYTEDIAKDYKVAIYADEECKQLVYSVSVLKGETLYQETICPPRFVFTGLTPATDYYVKVYNITDSKQTIDPVQVTTAASIMPGKTFNYVKAGDAVLFENFDGCIYGGDLTARAAGVSRSDRSSLTSFSGVDLKGELNLDYEATDGTKAYVAAAANIEIGLFNTLKGLLDDMGLSDWGWIGGKDGASGGSVCARPGYAKIGTSGNRSFIVTPMLSGIPAGTTAKVTVKFKAAPYGDVGKEINADEKNIVVKVLDGTSISSAYKITYTKEGESKALTLDGNRSSDWKEYSVTLSGVQSTSRIAIGGNRENATDTNRFLLDDVLVCVESLDKSVVSGTITYSDGAPAANVVVSDGFNCVKTDVMGKYSFIPHKDTWYIFYSIPADCEVPINSYGQPAFFTRYTGQKSCDFKLTKMAAKEEEFALFCLADPQCGTNTHISRFKAECVPDVWSHVKSKSIPCYGVTLGDVVYSEGNRNCNSLMSTMRGAMSKSVIGLPVFQTFGNHDYTYFNESNPSQPDATSSTYNLKMQRAFEDVFGPINYSWNRADTHIISMRNMQWSNNTAWNSYLDPRFTDEQCKWLEQDLAHVPTDKMVILCVHCSIFGSTNTNVQKVINMLKKYPNAHIMSGHHHRNQNEPTKSGGIYEHNIAAVCGCWWYSRINNDGSPNGYAVFEIKGNSMKNWYYKGVNEGMNDVGYQMRLYRGNMRCGGQYDYIQLQHGSNVILANVFNADSNWVVKVYEDGTYTGQMTLMSQSSYTPSIGTSESSPCKPKTSSSQDWYAIGYHTGVVGRGHSSVGGTRSNYMTPCYHMYKYTLKNSAAKVIRVEATDTFGNVYSSSTITGDYDYSLVAK